MTGEQLERQVRSLKLYLGILVCVFVICTALMTATRAQDQRQRFIEIDVERINVVERDGRLRLTISNRERSPGVSVGGKPQKRIGGNAAGLLFFNDAGEERGGLVYSSTSASLTFDKNRQSEILRLAYSENPQSSEGGLSVIDRPNEPPTDAEVERMIAEETKLRVLPPAERQAAMERRMKEMETVCVNSACGVSRIFTGKTADRSAVVVLSDAVGRPRLRLAVSARGEPSLEFLDANGQLVERLPPKQ